MLGKFRSFAFLAAVVLGLLPNVSVRSAAAATIGYQDYTGNDCAGAFGSSFDKCEDPTGSPIIAKFDLEEHEWTINTMFDEVVSSMFTLTYAGQGQTGSWSYDPGACTVCPVVTSFAVKSGDMFRWYFTDPKTAIFSGSWSTPNGQGLSHIAFYDTAPPPIPLPATGFLLIGALGAVGVAARRRRSV